MSWSRCMDCGVTHAAVYSFGQGEYACRDVDRCLKWQEEGPVNAPALGQWIDIELIGGGKASLYDPTIDLNIVSGIVKSDESRVPGPRRASSQRSAKGSKKR